MHDTEVLGVEVAQYKSTASHLAYAPRVVGRTSQAVEMKGGSGRRWDEAALLEVAEREVAQPEQQLLRRLFDHTRKHSEMLAALEKANSSALDTVTWPASQAASRARAQRRLS